MIKTKSESKISFSKSLISMQTWIDQNRDTWLEEFKTFLKFPSVSTDPEYKKSVQECVSWLKSYLEDLEFTTELWPVPNQGHPILFASHMKAGKDQPTILIYNHYDVQPADPEEEWTTPAFEPTIRDGQIYARGAQDNKGQCFYVLQALKLLLELNGSLPINIKLCIEGEEEIGSAGLWL